MKQQLSTAIDFYLQTDKTNPFLLHLNSNSSSRQLIQLRNHALILNKLSLLHLQPQSQTNTTNTFSSLQYCQLYATTLQAIINNPMMPFKDFQSIKSLLQKIQLYHHILQKLTQPPPPPTTTTSQPPFIKLPPNNTHWPRIRSLLISTQQKIPSTHTYIREYLTIHRGLMQTDKKYFLSQMMAKKIQTQQLNQLINLYNQQITQDNQQTHQQLIPPMPHIYKQIPEQQQIQQLNQGITWHEAKSSARMIILTDQQQDWEIVYSFLNGGHFRNQISEQQKEYIVNYLKDILSSLISQISINGDNTDKNKAINAQKNVDISKNKYDNNLDQNAINYKQKVSQILWKTLPQIPNN